MLTKIINELNFKGTILKWSKIIFSVVLIVIFVYNYDISGLWERLSGLNLILYFASFMIVVFGVFLSTLKWSILLKSLDIYISFLQLLRLYYIGSFFNMFLPGTVSGDVIRLGLFREQTGRLMRGGISIFAERFIGVLALWVITSISFLLNYNLFTETLMRELLIFILILTVVLLLSIVLFSNTKVILYKLAVGLERFKMFKIASAYKNIMFAIDSLFSNKWCMIKVFGLALLFQALSIVIKIIVTLALGVEIDWWLFFVLSPIVTTLVMLPVTFQGIGLREWSYVVLFGMFGVATNDILAVSTVVFSLVIANSLLGGLIYIIPVRGNDEKYGFDNREPV